MMIMKMPAALLSLALVAVFGLSACKTSAPSSSSTASDEHKGKKRHVHADGSVHYH